MHANHTHHAHTGYPGVSLKLMRVFKCLNVEDDWFLEADMRLQCFTPEWTLVALVAIVTICAYTVGLPIGIAVWLRSRRTTLEAPNTKKELGFLYEFYGTQPGVYLWEVSEGSAVCAWRGVQ